MLITSWVGRRMRSSKSDTRTLLCLTADRVGLGTRCGVLTWALSHAGRTIRRRLAEWAHAGLAQQVLRSALAAYDQMIGLHLADLAVDGVITKAPCGGEVAGRSPVDRGKQGIKRSVATDGEGIPLSLVAACANNHDSPLLEPTLTGIPDMIGPLPDLPGMHRRQGPPGPRML